MNKMLRTLICLVVVLMAGRAIAQPVTITPGTAICAGTTVTFSASLADTTATYLWTVNSTVVSTDSTFTSNTLVNGDTVIFMAHLNSGLDSLTDSFYMSVTTGVPYVAAITGVANICVSSTAMFTDSVSDGVWTASNGNATVAADGTVTGVSAGVDTIVYTVANVCGSNMAGYVMTVDTAGAPASPISGVPNICVASAVTFTDELGGGTWTATTGNASVATDGTVTGVSYGADTIVYTGANACGSVMASYAVNIDTPLGALPLITVVGTPTNCAGTTVQLDETATGGAWSSTNPVRATVDAAGLVTLHAGGGDTIKYTVTNSCGAVYAWHFIDIHPMPHVAPILPDTAVCMGSTTTLHNAVPGGTWSSSLPIFAAISSTGVVDGLLHGTTVIRYTVTNACGTASDSINFSVDVPAGPIIGSDVLCAGSLGVFFDPIPGGNWSSDNLFSALPITSGSFLGLLPGSVNIIYTLDNACGTTTSELPITVEICASAVAPLAGITEELKVYPNPSDGAFTLELTSADKTAAQVMIVNMLGEKVYEQAMGTNEPAAVQLAVPAGVYQVMVKTATREYMQKIVVDK